MLLRVNNYWVTDYCNRLNFAIYEMDGSRVKQINQTSDKAGFGTASFSLEEGEYQLVVALTVL